MNNLKYILISLSAFAIAFVSAQTVSASAYIPYPQIPPKPAFTVIPIGEDISYTSTPASNQPTQTTTHATTTTTTVIQPVKPLPKETTVTTVTNPIGLPPVVTTQSQNSGNELTALSIRGSGGFMPSSIWQWLLVILLILAVVIIARALTARGHDGHGAHAH
ncbi:MAG: hypothetical protein V4665_01040 [Patescibacteria group bacterium]